MAQHPEVEDHDHADEDLEDQDELALGDEVGLAGLVDQLRHFAHRRVDRQILQLREDEQTEPEAERADDETAHEQRAPVHAVKVDGRQIRQDEIRLAAAGLACRALRCHARLRRGRLGPEDRERRGHDQQGDAKPPEISLHGHTHSTSRKSWDYRRTLGGNAMPPVRNTRMPSSTEISGNTARSRSQITMSPR